MKSRCYYSYDMVDFTLHHSRTIEMRVMIIGAGLRSR